MKRHPKRNLTGEKISQEALKLPVEMGWHRVESYQK